MSNFKGLKLHPIHDFKQKKTFQIKKAISRPGYEKTAISIEFKHHPTQKVSYRIKRVLIQILSGHVLELILTEIFYGFLNIYKNFKDFTGAKYCQISKA